jgi:hypothetical protein
MSYNLLIVIGGGFTFDVPATIPDFTLTTPRNLSMPFHLRETEL